MISTQKVPQLVQSSLDSNKLRLMYPSGSTFKQQSGLVLVLTLIILSVLFLMLSFGWEQFFSNAKTVSATKQNIMSYQVMRGSLISNAYEVKNKSRGLNDAINGRGAEVDIQLPDLASQQNDGLTVNNIRVTLRRLNQGDTAGSLDEGVVPTIYRHLCTNHSIGTGNDNRGGFECHHMLLTSEVPLTTIAGSSQIKQMVGFGISTK